MEQTKSWVSNLKNRLRIVNSHHQRPGVFPGLPRLLVLHLDDILPAIGEGNMRWDQDYHILDSNTAGHCLSRVLINTYQEQTHDERSYQEQTLAAIHRSKQTAADRTRRNPFITCPCILNQYSNSVYYRIPDGINKHSPHTTLITIARPPKLPFVVFGIMGWRIPRRSAKAWPHSETRTELDKDQALVEAPFTSATRELSCVLQSVL
jgi:hypothetical protein